MTQGTKKIFYWLSTGLLLFLVSTCAQVDSDRTVDNENGGESSDNGFEEWQSFPEKLGRTSTDGWEATPYRIQNNPTGNLGTYFWKLHQIVDLTQTTRPQLTLSYEYTGSNYESFQVMVGNATTTDLDEFQILHEESTATQGVRELQVDLSKYAGYAVKLQLVLKKPAGVIENQVGLSIHETELVDLENPGFSPPSQRSPSLARTVISSIPTIVPILMDDMVVPIPLPADTDPTFFTVEIHSEYQVEYTYIEEDNGDFVAKLFTTSAPPDSEIPEPMLSLIYEGTFAVPYFTPPLFDNMEFLVDVHSEQTTPFVDCCIGVLLNLELLDSTGEVVKEKWTLANGLAKNRSEAENGGFSSTTLTAFGRPAIVFATNDETVVYGEISDDETGLTESIHGFRFKVNLYASGSGSVSSPLLQVAFKDPSLKINDQIIFE